jgi:hypothetical protein
MKRERERHGKNGNARAYIKDERDSRGVALDVGVVIIKFSPSDYLFFFFLFFDMTPSDYRVKGIVNCGKYTRELGFYLYFTKVCVRLWCRPGPIFPLKFLILG